MKKYDGAVSVNDDLRLGIKHIKHVSPFILKPNSPAKILWDLIVNVSLIISYILMTYIMATEFSSRETFFILDLSLDVILAVDIVLTFITE